jgi:hypothetical protein
LAQYTEALEGNRRRFSDAHTSVRDAFQILDSAMEMLVTFARDPRAPQPGLNVIPMLWLLRRQTFIALDSLASQQAYQAWVSIRPGLEAALIIGRWFDHPHLRTTWEQRWKDPEAYRRAYSGTKLQSSALPRSAEFQTSLGLINDHFLHPNPSYAFRHLKATKREDSSIELEFNYFDDSSFHWASVLALLHLLISVSDSMGLMLAARSRNHSVCSDAFGFLAFQSDHAVAVSAAAAAGTLEAFILHSIGLWPRAA